MIALPSNPDVERLVLGSILLDGIVPPDLAEGDFSTERDRRIFRVVRDLESRAEAIDSVTVSTELERRGQREVCGGLSYLTSLDDGLPRLPHLDQYVKVLKEHATRRRIIIASENLKLRAADGTEALEAIIAAGAELFTQSVPSRQAYRSIEDLPCIAECGATDLEYIRPELPRGAVVALTGDAGSGKSTVATAWARDAYRLKGIPSLFLDRENPLNVIADRLSRLGTEDGPGLRFWGGWLPDEAPMPDSPLVRQWAAEHRGIVVVDSFSAYLDGDQNDASVCRLFMHKLRRLADVGSTVVILHHSGKGESSADYRGSSDFKAAIDVGFHLSNFGSGRLDRILLRPFKARMGSDGEIAYSYADGEFVRTADDQVNQTASERLTAILRQSPGVTGQQFESLAASLGRNRARTWLADGVLSGAITRRRGKNNASLYHLSGEQQ